MKQHWPVFLLLVFACPVTSPFSPAEKEGGRKEVQESGRTGVQLFAPGIISTGLNELNATFSPDGSLFLYTIANNSSSHTFYTIFFSQKRNGKWSRPAIAPFSGQYSDADPFFAPDGRGLYFISLRPRPGTDEVQKNFDVWYVAYDNDRWLNPQYTGDSVNSDKDELYPAVSQDGNLFFSRETVNGYDIMMSSATSTGYSLASPIKGALNTRGIEYDAYVSPDERFIIFTAIGRGDSSGSGDLYISYNHGGEWSAGKNLGDEINSKFMDQCPSMSPDGTMLLFTSFRDNDSFSFQQPVKTADYLEVLSSAFNGLGNIFQIPSRHIPERSTSNP